MTRGKTLSRPSFGLLLAILALVSQLALGAMVLPDQATAADRTTLDAVAVLCRGGTPAPHRPTAPHHTSDHALCPLSVALALPAVALTPGAPVPPPSSTRLIPAWARPAATGPPAALSSARFARGPPVLA